MALRPDNSITPADKKAVQDEARQDVFLREVDEAVRQDQMATAARRFGIPLAIAVVLGIAGLGGYLFWQSQQHARAEADAVELTLAVDRLEANQPDAALTKIAPLASSEFAGTRVPAQLLQAGIAQGKGEADKAAKLYAAIAADADAPQPMRDLATVRLVSLQYDTMKSADVIAKLKPLAVPGKAFFASAGEMVGMAYIEQGKTDLAGPLFAEISRDEKAPEALRARARQIAGLLGTDAIDDVEELMEQIERNSAARQSAQQQAVQPTGQ
ncbi:tetratricopeptide repeat protein [Croceicoccus ponticola]|uniref:tetratricopeptide repeat protein n=1 Tax=Croceicoccus ponticola TaxID=2217664 RepID=UPI0013E3317B|nr:tetratricopeptide repeat protein [Croceicoccus ponticola]